MSDTAPRPRLSRTTKLGIATAVFVIWTLMASAWNSKGCDMVLDSYVYVVQHGTPDPGEGCEEGRFGATYTHDYDGRRR